MAKQAKVENAGLFKLPQMAQNSLANTQNLGLPHYGRSTNLGSCVQP